MKVKGKGKLNIGIYGKKLRETPYQREIMAMPPDLINAVNRDGGLRMFGSGDYRGKLSVRGPGGKYTTDFKQVETMLDHATQKGLYIKAITKQRTECR